MELSIKATYLEDWGISEGVRELVQNTKDADVDGYPMEISVLPGNIVRFENKDAVLPHKALLFGHTTKTDRDNQIGRFGEGMKLGILALVRAGRKVIVRSGNEIWVPHIGYSQTFDENVLCFDINKSIQSVKSFQVDVQLTAAEWEAEKKNFLFISPPQNVIKNWAGAIILDPEYAGKVFVKGIFVQHDPQLVYGYDLPDTETDRDRRIIKAYKLDAALRNIWYYASAVPELYDIFYDLLYSDAKDVKFFEYTADLDPALMDHLEKRWKGEFGNAFPVHDAGDVVALGHLGEAGILIPSRSFVHIMQLRFGTVDELKKKLFTLVKNTIELPELKPAERLNFLKALKIVNNAVDKDLRQLISIAEFDDERILGQFKEGRIYLSRRTLETCPDAILTLVHEVAHFYGGDGDRSHIDALHSIWREILSNLLREGK